MTTEVKLPELGENIEAGIVTDVLVSPGDMVETDQPILELETDKAVVEVPSPVAGKVVGVLPKEGDEVRIGAVILTIDENVDAAPAEGPTPVQAENATPEPEIEPAAVVEPESTQTASVNIQDVTLPELGENIEAGIVTSVLVSPGEAIDVDQSIIEVETDKAVAEVPSPFAGTVKTVEVAEGADISIGAVILTLETTGVASVASSAPAPVERKEASTPATKTPEPVAEKPATMVSDPVSPGKTVPAAPSVRRVAREIGVDVAEVKGTGAHGRITLEDVKAHSKRLHEKRTAAPVAATGTVAKPLPDFAKWGTVERESMSNVRRKTAEHLSYSWNAIPHVFQFSEADVTDLEAWRKKMGPLVERAGAKLTITAVLLKIVAEAMKHFPQFNASVDTASNEIVLKKYTNIGIAVDTDRGLLVPVIRDVDQKSITDLSVELTEISKKARDKKLTLDDMQGGNFTISNLGGIGGTNFTPVVNWPEVAIMGVSRSSMKPVYIDGEFKPRLVLPLTLSYDHRVIDGADGARYMRWITGALEDPLSMLL
jgi:pyruvate dehydrogenase E2 component (dihydrolipoamide acetyltransferase)